MQTEEASLLCSYNTSILRIVNQSEIVPAGLLYMQKALCVRVPESGQASGGRGKGGLMLAGQQAAGVLRLSCPLVKPHEDHKRPRLNRRVALGNRGVTPLNREVTLGNRGVTPLNRGVTLGNRGVTPLNRRVTLGNRGVTLLNRRVTPLNRIASPKDDTGYFG
jgi:hypothetical protein